MPVNRAFNKLQKERSRQEKATAKRQRRSDRRRLASGSPRGSGPPIDYEARVGGREGAVSRDPDREPRP